MRHRSFRRVLEGIVSVVVAGAACAAGAAACGGTSGSGGSGDGGVILEGDGGVVDPSLACNPPLADIVTNLTPALAVDYLELRRQTIANPGYNQPDGGDADAGAGPTSKTVSSNGTVCATAANRDACLAALAAAKLESASEGWGDGVAQGNAPTPPTVDRNFLVYTRGDVVGIVRSREELLAFFGKVDTLEEARLVLTVNGYHFECSADGKPAKAGWRKNADGSFELLAEGSGCDSYTQIRLRVGVDGTVTTISRVDSPVACGRRPAGLREADERGAASGLGAYFAEVAYLEAASVVAFRRLEDELRAFGAPASLLRRAQRARRDEIRHARDTAAMARRFGAEVTPLGVADPEPRTRLAVAVENAVEGCVRETYGALVAAFQARRAKDPDVRRLLLRIARDEARHAELSRDVAVWLDTKLDASERAVVTQSRRRALEELGTLVEQAPASDVVEMAGMPTVTEARALLEGLEQELPLARAA